MRAWLPLLLLLPMLGFGLALASPAEPAAQDPEQAEEDHGPLEEAMLEVKASIRALRRSLKKPEQDAASLTSITRLQSAMVEAKGQAPRMTESLPEDKRAAFVVAYRTEMLELLEASFVLERAILAKDREAVTAAFAGMRGLEDPAHERFIEDE